ncbi:hypothetical protein GCM10009844_44000 [Nocardioides koreensis]|uniref:DUF4304 domain-containing protein n=1 Tax=Nocardioides koreensis TaxID=433651 RepID=A0ABP5LXT8_9ACTN
MGEAQERLDRLLKTVWGPALRDLGFKGSGKVWTLPDENDWAMLGFQTSQASTADEAKFTINLMVVGKTAWDEARTRNSFYSGKPSPNTIAHHRYVQRAGHLTHGRDHWWRLAGDGRNEQHIRDEVLDNLLNVIVPKLKSEMADQTPGPRGTFEGVGRG